MMNLAQLVTVVELVRATAKKTEKVRLLAELLRQTRGQERELAALYLCGSLPQGKIGVGWTVLQKAMAEGPLNGERLTISDVDRVLTAVDQPPRSHCLAGAAAVLGGGLVGMPSFRNFPIDVPTARSSLHRVAQGVGARS